jgi:hypothetical protein
VNTANESLANKEENTLQLNTISFYDNTFGLIEDFISCLLYDMNHKNKTGQFLKSQTDNQ